MLFLLGAPGCEDEVEPNPWCDRWAACNPGCADGAGDDARYGSWECIHALERAYYTCQEHTDMTCEGVPLNCDVCTVGSIDTGDAL